MLNRDTWFDPITAPSNIAWSKEALRLGEKLRVTLISKLQSGLTTLREAGAEQVKIRYSTFDANPGVEFVSPFGYKVRSFELLGLAANGKLIKRTASYPQNGITLANAAVYLKQEKTCSLLQFNIFSPKTWFADRCEIERSSSKQILRAALTDDLAANIGSPEVIDNYLSELHLVLAKHLPYSIKNGVLICPSLVSSDISGDPRIPLFGGKYGRHYKIEVNGKQNTAIARFYLPEYQKLANSAVLLDGVISFSAE